MPRVFLALLVVLVLAPAASADLLTSDMTLAHEHHPHGVPTAYDWYGGPVTHRTAAPAGWTAFEAWGQFYRCAEAPHDADDELEIRNVQTWDLDGTGWHEYQTGVLDGAAYPESFQGSAVAPDVVARSLTASYFKVRLNPEGYNFHFYPHVRAPWSPSIQAVVVLGEVRLTGRGVKANCVVAGVGGDFWSSPSSGYPNVTGAMLGRLKHVDGGWRVVSASIGAVGAGPPTTFPDSELR